MRSTLKRRDHQAIFTYSGGWFHPLAPRLDEVSIKDIAHALGMVCRFTGHGQEFYSVAEHCIHVSRLVPRRDALAGLLHDAAEAYLCDVSSPVKHSPGFAYYRRAEARLQRIIFKRFGLGPRIPESVHNADFGMAVTEARALFPVFPSWTDGLAPAPVKLLFYAPGVAAFHYRERFEELV